MSARTVATILAALLVSPALFALQPAAVERAVAAEPKVKNATKAKKATKATKAKKPGAKRCPRGYSWDAELRDCFRERRGSH